MADDNIRKYKKKAPLVLREWLAASNNGGWDTWFSFFTFLEFEIKISVLKSILHFYIFIHFFTQNRFQ